MNIAKEIVENKYVEIAEAAEEMAVTSAYRYDNKLKTIVTVYVFEDGSYMIEDGIRVLHYSE